MKYSSLNLLFSHKILLWFSAVIFLLSGCSGQGRVIKDPDVAWKEKKFALAARLYEKKYPEATTPFEKAEISFKAAESHRMANNTQRAEIWYKNAIDNRYNDARMFFNYGLMLKANEKYDQAIESFMIFAREEPFEREKAEREVKACQAAKLWKEENSNVLIVELERVNSSANDFAPTFFENDKIVFCSTRGEATGDQKDGWTNQNFSDLWVSDIVADGQLSSPVSFSKTLNSPWHEGPACFNSNFTVIYFTRCGSANEKGNDYCAIWASNIGPDGKWNTPELQEIFSDTVNVGHPFLLKDGSTLLFASDAPGGYGGRDLWQTTKTPFGWSKPVNLGSDINTDGDELFPFVDEENNLYFASNGHPGMGGLDIFKAERAGNKWTKPQNLRPPLNSGADDFGFIIKHRAKDKVKSDNILSEGYFVSARQGGKGADDLYRFVYEFRNFFRLDGIVVENVFEKEDDPNSPIVGKKPVEGSVVELRKMVNGNPRLIGKVTTDKDGKFRAELSAETDYNIFGTKYPDYLNRSVDITTKNLRDPDNTIITIKVEILLDKIFQEKEIVIPNIYYDYDKTTLRDESLPVLDKILVLLEENPNVKVELGSHTDSRGSDEYNLRLSQGRAESVVNHLAKKGINPERMVAKGYGESRLVNECADGIPCSEEKHQENRRTTFRILGKNFELESVQPDSILVDPKPGN